jgi:glycosyltransferase involved in cell wall biosynthesis
MSAPRVAIVHDWLDTWRGGENVLAELIGQFPDADLYALVDFLPDDLRPRILGKRARTSYIQHLPGARRYFRRYLPLFPRAIESLDLGGYDLVVSNSHAFAKGARVGVGQLHLCYCHTPMRYAWDLQDQYLSVTGLAHGLRGTAVRRLLAYLREWDRKTAARVDRFAANSRYIADRIARAYGRSAEVIHPPVDLDFYAPAASASQPASREYFVTASRWVPYKRVDLVVGAFARLGTRRVVIGDGPDAPRVHAQARPNVEFVGEVSRERLRDLMRDARAFVFAAEEDFGILPVEAQACGTPVIAYGRGGALETVSTQTGAFFNEQSVDAIVDAVRTFNRDAPRYDAASCRRNAERFGSPRFRRDIRRFVDDALGARLAVPLACPARS